MTHDPFLLQLDSRQQDDVGVEGSPQVHRPTVALAVGDTGTRKYRIS